MIVSIQVMRLLSNNKSKYLIPKNDEYLMTPNGINFPILYQLLCQDLNLYSTKALQNRKLNKSTREQERNKLTAVHAGLDEAQKLFDQHKSKICLDRTDYSIKSNNICIYKKYLRMFVELVLLETLNVIEQKGIYRWENLLGKEGLWREFSGNKLIPMGAETTFDKNTKKTYIKFTPVPNIIV